MDVYELFEIAKDCGCFYQEDIGRLVTDDIDLVKFAAAVADKTKDETFDRANASWSVMCKKMVAFEREACAKIADEWSVGYPHPSSVIAEHIRARGEQE